MTRKQLRGPVYRRLLHDTYIAASEPLTDLVHAQAAVLRAGDRARCSHFTAARLYDLPVPDASDAHVTVDLREDRVEVEGMRCHVRRGSTWRFRGTRTTAPTAVFVDLAPYLSLVDLVVLGDALVGPKGHTTLDELRIACRRASGTGAREARRAIGYVRERVESPMESRLRMLIVLAGLPEPDEINLEVVDARGRRRRIDLLYTAIKLGIEYDGKGHRIDDAKWQADMVRREDLARAGYELVGVLASGIYNRPEETLERISVALRERGVAVPSLDPRWRSHFRAKA